MYVWCGDGRSVRFGITSILCVVQTLLQPFVWLGMNPIAVFIGMVALEIILLDSAPKVTCWGCEQWLDGMSDRMTVWDWIYWKGFVSWIPDRYGASMVVASLHVLLWEVVAGLMYWRRIFLKL